MSTQMLPSASIVVSTPDVGNASVPSDSFSHAEAETKYKEGNSTDFPAGSSTLKGMEKVEGAIESGFFASDESAAVPPAGDLLGKSVTDTGDSTIRNINPLQPITMEQLLSIASGNNPKKSHFNPNAEEFIPLGIANKNLASAMAFGQKIFGKSLSGPSAPNSSVANATSSGAALNSTQVSSVSSSSSSNVAIPLASSSGNTSVANLGSTVSTKSASVPRFAKSPARPFRGSGTHSSPMLMSGATLNTVSNSSMNNFSSSGQALPSTTTSLTTPTTCERPNPSLSFSENGSKDTHVVAAQPPPSSPVVAESTNFPSTSNRTLTSVFSAIPPPPPQLEQPAFSASVSSTPITPPAVSPIKGGKAPVGTGTTTLLASSPLPPSSFSKPQQSLSVSPLANSGASIPPLSPAALPPPATASALSPVTPSKGEQPVALSATPLKTSASSLSSGGTNFTPSNALTTSLSALTSVSTRLGKPGVNLFPSSSPITDSSFSTATTTTMKKAPLATFKAPTASLPVPSLLEEGVTGDAPINSNGMRPSLKFNNLDPSSLSSSSTYPFVTSPPPGYAPSQPSAAHSALYEKLLATLPEDKLSMLLAEHGNENEGLSKYLEKFLRETVNPTGGDGSAKEGNLPHPVANDATRLQQVLNQLMHRNKESPPQGLPPRAPYSSAVGMFGNERRQPSPLRAPFEVAGSAEFRPPIPSIASAGTPAMPSGPMRWNKAAYPPIGNVSSFSTMGNQNGSAFWGGNRLSPASSSSTSIPPLHESVVHTPAPGVGSSPVPVSSPSDAAATSSGSPVSSAREAFANWEKIEFTGSPKGPAEGFPVVECQGKLFALDNRPSGGFAEIYTYENFETTHRWTLVRNCRGHAPPANSNFDMFTYNGKLFAIGGRIKEGADFFTMWEFDIVELAWTHHEIPINSDLLLRRQDYAVVMCGGALYLFGGVYATQPQQWILLNDLWCLPLQEKRWKRLHPYTGSEMTLPGGGTVENIGDIPPGRAGHTAVAYEKSIYIFGGTTTALELDDLYEYNTVTHTWTRMNPAGNVPAPRYGHSADVIEDRMILFGGFGDCHTFLNDVHELSFTKMTWTRVMINKGKILPIPRFRHSTVALDGFLYLFGGKGNPKHFSTGYARGSEGNNGLEKVPKMAAFTDSFRIRLNHDFDAEKDQSTSVLVRAPSPTPPPGSFTEEIVSFRIRQADGTHKDIPLSESATFAAQWAKFMEFNKTEREYVQKISHFKYMISQLCQEVATLTVNNKRLHRQTLSQESAMQNMMRSTQASQAQVEALALAMFRQHSRSLITKVKQNELTIEDLKRLCREQQSSLEVKEKELQRLRDTLRFDNALWPVHPSVNRSSQSSASAFSNGGGLPAVGSSLSLRQGGGEAFSSLLTQSRPPGISGPPTAWPTFFPPPTTNEGFAEAAARTMASSPANSSDPSYLLPLEESGLGSNNSNGTLAPFSQSFSSQGVASDISQAMAPSFSDPSAMGPVGFSLSDTPIEGVPGHETSAFVSVFSAASGSPTAPVNDVSLSSSVNALTAPESEILAFTGNASAGNSASTASYSFLGQSNASSRNSASSSPPQEGISASSLTATQRMAIIAFLQQHPAGTTDPDITRKICSLLGPLQAPPVSSSAVISSGVSSTTAMPGGSGDYFSEGVGFASSGSSNPFSSSHTVASTHGYMGEMNASSSLWDGNSGKDSSSLFGLMSTLKTSNNTPSTNISTYDQFVSGNNPPPPRAPLGGLSGPGTAAANSSQFYTSMPVSSVLPSSPSRPFPSTNMAVTRPAPSPFLSTNAGGNSAFLSATGNALDGGNASSISYGGKGGTPLHGFGTTISPPVGSGLGPVGPSQLGHSTTWNRSIGTASAPPPPSMTASSRKEGFGTSTGASPFFSSNQFVTQNSGNSPGRAGATLPPHELIKKAFPYGLSGATSTGKTMSEFEGYRMKGFPPRKHPGIPVQRDHRPPNMRFQSLLRGVRPENIPGDIMMSLRDKAPISSESYAAGNSAERFISNHVFGGGTTIPITQSINGGTNAPLSGTIFESVTGGIPQSFSAVAAATAGASSSIPSAIADSMAQLLNLSLSSFHSTGSSIPHATEASVASTLRGNTLVPPSGSPASAGTSSGNNTTSGVTQGFSLVSSDFPEETSLHVSHSHHFGESYSSSTNSLTATPVDKTLQIEEIEWTIPPDANIESDAELPTWV